MIKARQKGVRKVNETKIKVPETNGNHQGYIEWIEKFNFGNLPVEDRRMTKNEQRTMKNGWKSLRNHPRKHYENITEAPRLGFSSRKQFFSPILSDYEVPEGLNPFHLHSSLYL